MDVDAFVARHQTSWTRLDQLCTQAKQGRAVSRLSADDVTEALSLYQRTSTHLAVARTNYPAEQALLARLTMVVARAHGTLNTRRETRDPARALRRFFTHTFPGAVWRFRRFVLISALLTFVPWAAMQVWVANSPDAFRAVDQQLNEAALTEDDFEDYYTSEPAQDFASKVFFNNVRVAALAFALGLLLCVFTAALLVHNGINGGIWGGLFTYEGEWQRFWGLILPHGLIELSAIVVAGGAGLAMGWTIISPGDRTRVGALAEEARHAGGVLIGLVLAFGVAALIEGFVTGRVPNVGVRVGIGVVAFVAFWGSIVLLGPRAAQADRTLPTT
jgi:uncharacterized membrane protein SpoIIM required for sporulation